MSKMPLNQSKISIGHLITLIMEVIFCKYGMSIRRLDVVNNENVIFDFILYFCFECTKKSAIMQKISWYEELSV